jgi:hypothetical protein
MNLMEDQQAPQSAEGEAKVITLCGSTKFEAEFAEVNQRLTMEGCVVISLGMFSLPDLPGYDWTADSSDLKGRLGGVHLQKIRMADEVYIVDPGGYVGESTRREIAYAESLGKPVRYLSRERLARTSEADEDVLGPARCVNAGIPLQWPSSATGPGPLSPTRPPRSSPSPDANSELDPQLVRAPSTSGRNSAGPPTINGR